MIIILCLFQSTLMTTTMCAYVLAYLFLGKLRANSFLRHYFEDLFSFTQLAAAMVAVILQVFPSDDNNNNNDNNISNNNEYVQRLTRTGLKRLHDLYKYLLSKFNAYNMNAHTHARTHTDSHTHARAHTHAHT